MNGRRDESPVSQSVNCLSEAAIAMPFPILKTCPFLGPISNDEPLPIRSLPADYETQPLRHLPPIIALSEAELDLARRYEQGDFSGGYIASQVAYFRRGPSAENHQHRRGRFRQLKTEVNRLGLVLPPFYIELVESDDFIARLRHNSIWPTLPDHLVALPSSPEYKLFLIFREGQGCGYWHLLLGSDGEHIVTFSAHPLGRRNAYPPGHEPDIASMEIYQCAENFSQWIVNFFVECVEADRDYEELLQKYPNM